MAEFKPEGWPTVIPRLFTTDVAGLAAFMQAVFGARGEVNEGRPSELRIGESIVMVSDGGGVREGTPGFLYLYVENADATWRQAMDHGGRSLEDPADMPWGDRRATVQDAWGNTWQIATHRAPHA